MNQKTWILISDVSKAKLFQEEGRLLKELGDFIHPEGTMKIENLISDASGRRGMGQKDRPGLTSSTNPKETESKKFAHELAMMLKQGLDAHRFEALVLVAPPHFLGLLRKTLDPQVSKKVTASIDRDFMEFGAKDLLEHLHSLQTASLG